MLAALAGRIYDYASQQNAGPLDGLSRNTSLTTMGLDLVEYVMAVEDAFQISIPNDAAAFIDTPQKLIDYLCEGLGESTDGPPLVQMVFYRVRAALAEELAVPRSTIRPSTLVADLSDRPYLEVWDAVALRLGVSPRDVTHAPVVRWLAQMKLAAPRSVGAVAEQLAMLRPAALKPSGPWTRSQITDVVLRLLTHETGVVVGREDVRLTFTRDLGMG